MKLLSATARFWSRRLILAGVALIAGGMYYEQTINHVRARENVALQSRITDARRVITEIEALEAKVLREREELDALQDKFPPTPALVWFPERVKQHFRQFSDSEAVTRLNTAVDEPALPGFERSYWAVEMPAGTTSEEIRELCLAISEFERLHPAARVVDVAIRPDSDHPERRLMVVNLAVLAPKRTRA